MYRDTWGLVFTAATVVIPWAIDPSNISHSAPVPYHTMHHFVTEMYVCVFWSSSL